MAAENTHIYLADQIKGEIGNHSLKALLDDHKDYYFFGSIFPDILFYSKDRLLFTMAYNLHGEDGIPTHQIVFDILDKARSKKDRKNFSFIAGFLTHYAVDMTFHPVIFYISGYKAEGNKKEQDRSSYLHWHYEADINRQINHSFRLDRMIRPELIRDLSIPEVLGIEKRALGKAMRRQIRYSRITHSYFYYLLFNVLYRLGFYPAGAIAGFDHNLKKESLRLPDPIQYRDLLTGAPLQTTLTELITTAVQSGCRMIETGYAYYSGKKNRAECEKIIAGQSLETGQAGKTTVDIRFAAPLL